MVFHSLSKRSSLPGMRSGFVAGDEELIKKFKLYRTYHGCAMSPPFQKASIAAWRDEEHVKQNRVLYRQKFDIVVEKLSGLLDVKQPGGSFYLWPKTPISDTEFSKLLFEQQNLTVLPGSYLSRDFNGENPGRNRVRMALVAPIAECVEGAERLKEFLISVKEKV
jgi:N-succinyldiaminopimelate aminotransferase